MATINHKSVKDFHQQQVINGIHNDHKSQSIIDCLGGIDVILSNYILSESESSTKITDEELNQIYQILSKSSSKINHAQKSIKSLENRGKDIVYTFDEKETYLNTYLNPKTAEIFRNFFIKNRFSSSMIKIMLILSMIVFMYSITCQTNTLWYCIFIITINITLWIPYTIYWCLSFNKEGFKLILFRFEFWLKVLYSIFAQILSLIDDFILNYNKWSYPNWKIPANLFLSFDITMIIISVSMLDALNVNHKWKKIMTIFQAFMLSLWAILLQYKLWSDPDGQNNNSIIYIASGFAINLLSMRVAIFRTLAIFTIKQAIQTVIKSKSGKTSMIRITPRIVWISNNPLKPASSPTSDHGHNSKAIKVNFADKKSGSGSEMSPMDVEVLDFVVNEAAKQNKVAKDTRTQILTETAVDGMSSEKGQLSDIEGTDPGLTIVYEGDGTVVLPPNQLSISNTPNNAHTRYLPQPSPISQPYITTGISIKRIKSLNDDVNTYQKESVTGLTALTTITGIDGTIIQPQESLRIEMSSGGYIIDQQQINGNNVVYNNSFVTDLDEIMSNFECQKSDKINSLYD